MITMSFENIRKHPRTLNTLVKLSRTINAFVLCLHALNVLAQHDNNTRVLLQIHRGMYKCAYLKLALELYRKPAIFS